MNKLPALSGIYEAPLEEAVFHVVDQRIAVHSPELVVVCDGAVLNVTRTQGRIALILSKEEGSTLDYQTFVTQVYGYNDEDALQTARVHVSNLRGLFGPELGHRTLGALRNERGVGYYMPLSLAEEQR